MDRWLSTGCASCICACKESHMKCIHTTYRTTVNPSCKVFTAGRRPLRCLNSWEEIAGKWNLGRILHPMDSVQLMLTNHHHLLSVCIWAHSRPPRRTGYIVNDFRHNQSFVLQVIAFIKGHKADQLHGPSGNVLQIKKKGEKLLKKIGEGQLESYNWVLHCSEGDKI